VTVCSLGCLFVVAELSARYCLRRFGRYYVWPPYSRTQMEIDSSVLPMMAPTTRFDVNEAGERGDPLPSDLAHTYRVLVGGGSATECYYMDQEASWPYVVQRLLNQKRNL